MSHNVNAREKKFLSLSKNVKGSQGYSSNIKSLVSIKDLKLVGLKSHDCHVLIQQLLSGAARGILPEKVRVAITRLCFSLMLFVARLLTHKNWIIWRMKL